MLLNSEEEVGVCLGAFTQTYGLPCKHVLKTYIERSAPIPLDSIHPQWHLMIEQPLHIRGLLEDQQFSPRTDVANHIQGFLGSLTDA
jgi:hypothetical protein